MRRSRAVALLASRLCVGRRVLVRHARKRGGVGHARHRIHVYL